VIVTIEEQLEATRRMRAEQQRMLERRGETLERIANLLYGPAHEPGASDAVKDAYAIAREAR
jgi:hypothetical protein